MISVAALFALPFTLAPLAVVIPQHRHIGQHMQAAKNGEWDVDSDKQVMG
jgi:hypothetical protein